MPRDLAPSYAPGPFSAIGQVVLGPLSYLGGLAILVASAARATFASRGRATRLGPCVIRQLDWLFITGLPLVALTHIGIGSFLTMQAFFGATFIEAAGPVVAIGLVRNVAPLLTGLAMAALLAAHLTPELKTEPHTGLDDPDWLPDRETALGREPDPRGAPEPARLAASRLIAAVLAGPALVLWGTVVGTGIGCMVARVMLGVSPWIFFNKALEMFWLRDAIGVIGKGALFALTGAALACHEGLREGPDDPHSVRVAQFRAVCLSALAILFINNAWFMLAYHAGPPFGPTVLSPPPR